MPAPLPLSRSQIEKLDAAGAGVHVLLVYDRPAGVLVRQERYRDGNEALQARFVAEREFEGRDELEIVALSGSSVDALRVTHGRYFFSLDELAARTVPPGRGRR